MTNSTNNPWSEPRLAHVQCLGARGLHRMAYWEWGDPASRRVLVCVHGVSRQGRDFDVLAQRGRRVLRVHLSGDLEVGLETLRTATMQALAAAAPVKGG